MMTNYPSSISLDLTQASITGKITIRIIRPKMMSYVFIFSTPRHDSEIAEALMLSVATI
jgi:hypothetical protein